eukprot:jgi/Tetstr1/425903/TSEL_016274.t1
MPASDKADVLDSPTAAPPRHSQASTGAKSTVPDKPTTRSSTLRVAVAMGVALAVLALVWAGRRPMSSTLVTPPLAVLPPARLSSEAPLILRRGRVLPQHGRPTNSQHASTLVEAAPGEVIAAWFGGKWERVNGTSIWMARFTYDAAQPEAGAWGPAHRVAKDPGGGPLWNPVLFKDSLTGHITLFYKSGKNEKLWVGWRKVSKDGGRTWGRAKRLGHGLLGPAKNKPLQLPDGTILAPASDESGTEWPKWTAHLEASQDHGVTWVRRAEVLYEGDVIQGSLFVGKDGNVRMLLRLRDRAVKNNHYVNGRVVLAIGDAHGTRWVSVAPTGLPNPNSGLDAVMLRDGRLLTVLNPTTDTGGTRGPSRATLSIVMSDTDGQSWKSVTDLERVASSPDGKHWPTYSYPAIIQTSDGLVHVSYTYTEHVTIKPRVGRENIMHVVLNASSIIS